MSVFVFQKFLWMPLRRGSIALNFLYFILNAIMLTILIKPLVTYNYYRSIIFLPVQAEFLADILTMLTLLDVITAAALFYGLYKENKDVLKTAVCGNFAILVFHVLLMVLTLIIMLSIQKFGMINFFILTTLSAGVEAIVALTIRSTYIKMGEPGIQIPKQPASNPEVESPVKKETAVSAEIPRETVIPDASLQPTAPHASAFHQIPQLPYQFAYLPFNRNVFPEIPLNFPVKLTNPETKPEIAINSTNPETTKPELPVNSANPELIKPEDVKNPEV